MIQMKSLMLSSLCLLSLVGFNGCQYKIDDDRKPTTASKKTAASYNVQLGLTYLRKGDITRSKIKLLHAIELAPSSEDANSALAYFYDKTKNEDQAEHYYKLAIQYASAKGATYNNYGAFLCQHNKLEQAERYFLYAAKDNKYPKVSSAYENAGICSLKNRKYKKAKGFFTKAIEADPYATRSILELSKLALRQNQYKAARAYLKTYERIGEPTALSLWLNYELSLASGDRKAAKQTAKLLEKKFPNATETKKLKGFRVT